MSTLLCSVWQLGVNLQFSRNLKLPFHFLIFMCCSLSARSSAKLVCFLDLLLDCILGFFSVGWLIDFPIYRFEICPFNEYILNVSGMLAFLSSTITLLLLFVVTICWELCSAWHPSLHLRPFSSSRIAKLTSNVPDRIRRPSGLPTFARLQWKILSHCHSPIWPKPPIGRYGPMMCAEPCSSEAGSWTCSTGPALLCLLVSWRLSVAHAVAPATAWATPSIIYHDLS